MTVNLNTLNQIIIKNAKGDITDRINVGQLSYQRSKLSGNTLFVTEKE